MLLIEKLRRKPIEKHEMEFVERKGLGHPDYIIDLSCEAVSRALSRYYIDKFGIILHHNVDKGLLIGGSAKPDFGGGRVINPIEIIVAGRAVTNVKGKDKDIPVNEIALDAIKRIINKNFRFLDAEEHVSIIPKIRQGSVDLVALFEKKASAPLANDTSFGVAFAPLTNAEKIALNIERYLNSKSYKNIFPYVGEDVKVMVLRKKRKYNVTIATAFVDRFFKNKKEYLSAKEDVIDSIKDYLSRERYELDNIYLMLNTADDPDKDILYITVTGTSAEAGDDGNTGRGNRITGLITPNRQMSMEATAGKNPVSHVGKIYNVLAKKICERINNEVESIKEVYVKILSQIGAPITNPQAVHVQFIPKKGAREVLIRNKIDHIIEEEFSPDSFNQLTEEILDGKHTLF